MGALGEKITATIDAAGKVLFRIIGIIVRAAPIGAFGAMAFTIGAYGIGVLVNLGELIVCSMPPAFSSFWSSWAPSRASPDFRSCASSLHQGRAADRARHQLLRDGAAAHHPEDGAPGRLAPRGGPRDPGRLQLQPGRDQHLHDPRDATIVISRWEGELDKDRLREAMRHPVELGEALERQPDALPAVECL
jgi:hypothetical protein